MANNEGGTDRNWLMNCLSVKGIDDEESPKSRVSVKIRVRDIPKHQIDPVPLGWIRQSTPGGSRKSLTQKSHRSFSPDAKKTPALCKRQSMANPQSE